MKAPALVSHLDVANLPTKSLPTQKGYNGEWLHQFGRHLQLVLASQCEMIRTIRPTAHFLPQEFVLHWAPLFQDSALLLLFDLQARHFPAHLQNWAALPKHREIPVQAKGRSAMNWSRLKALWNVTFIFTILCPKNQHKIINHYWICLIRYG